MEYAPLIIDVLLLIVIIVSAVKAFKDGFFTSIVNLIGSIAGLFIAWFTAQKYSVIAFDRFFRDSLVKKTYEYLQTSGATVDVKKVVEGIVGVLPDSILNEFITSSNNAAQSINEPTHEAALLLVNSFLAPIVIAIISVIIFVAVLLVCKIAANLLAKILKAVNKIPLIGFANRIVGFGVGIAIGGVNIILLSCFLSIIAIATNNSISFLNMEVFAQSKILMLTKGINPFL